MYRLRPVEGSDVASAASSSALSSDMYRLRPRVERDSASMKCSALSSDMYRLRRKKDQYTTYYRVLH